MAPGGRNTRRASQRWAEDQKRQLYKQSTMLPKVVGVSYDKFQAIWVAHWRIDGKTFHKYFNTFKLGFEQAYHKAVECRLRNISQFNSVGIKPNSLESLLHSEGYNLLLDNTYAETKPANPNTDMIANTDVGLNMNPTEATNETNDETMTNADALQASIEASHALQMHKVTLHYILLDLKDLCPLALPLLAGYTCSELCAVIDAHISNIWQSSTLCEIQHYLDLFHRLIDHHTLPNTLSIEEQTAFLFTILKMPILRWTSDESGGYDDPFLPVMTF